MQRAYKHTDFQTTAATNPAKPHRIPRIGTVTAPPCEEARTGDWEGALAVAGGVLKADPVQLEAPVGI